MENRPVTSLAEWLSGSPSTAEALFGARPSVEAAHALTEAVSLYTQAPSEVRLQPLRGHALSSPGIPGLKLDNPRAEVLCGDAVRLDRVVVSGKGAAIIFIGAGAVLENVHIACHAELTIANIGYCGRVIGLFAHVYGRIGAVVLGPGTTMESGCNICIQGNSYLLSGDDVMLSTNVFLRTSDSHGIYDFDRKLINPPRPVILHSHVWISRSALLNKGTEVGPGTIVGQGSVTAGSLKSGCIYAGAPSTLVRSDVTWDRGMGKTLEPDHDFAQSHFNLGFRKRIDEINATSAPPLEAVVGSADLLRELSDLSEVMAVAGNAARETRLSNRLRPASAGSTP